MSTMKLGHLMMCMGGLLTSHLKRGLRKSFPKLVAYASYLKALFENEIELRLLSRLCNRNLTSIDAGAFTGTYTVGASIHSKDVIAVEPQPRQVEALRRCSPRNVTIIEAALSNISGHGILKMPSLEGGSMSRLGPHGGAEGGLEVPLRLMRIDDLDHEHVGFVKIDVEGHEAEVVEGAARTIELNRPFLLIEAEGRHRAGTVRRVTEFLTKLNYIGYFVYRGKVRPIQEFDPATHQKTDTLVAGPRGASGG